jgi:hypothetical protein
MPAYFVVELEVTNPAGLESYRAAVPARSRNMAVAS